MPLGPPGQRTGALLYLRHLKAQAEASVNASPYVTWEALPRRKGTIRCAWGTRCSLQSLDVDKTGRENSRATHLPIAQQQGEHLRECGQCHPLTPEDFREVDGDLPFQRDYKDYDYM